ncbi:hypothetical protein N7468_002523 [Penicillium chermesinum]|uniref:Uncharacterized protein n=1 Tax=Penicillium chermesinum TaxID=63820 RepID=A0A9W9TXQ1_9EURO|nr:uncharacterized protein N7468_002523 [Penicillium chermesinum]KAJ5247540.1 hypothetical protein N7468_002523 [Penicillium chermesinum]
MEKTDSQTPSTPTVIPAPVSACDVLTPLSQDTGLPTSGAVAARVRQQMRENASSPSPASSPSSSHSDSATRSGGELSPVQKRSETLLPMGKREGDAVRTWRRMIVEYR